jgi:sugar phosphate isomerase/epimerase
MYSFSTCWNSHRHTDGRAMLREIRELGFDHAELSHGIRISLLPGIYEAVEKGDIRISTLHNFCPLPLGVNHAAPNLFKFTSLDPRERESAYRHTVKTIETASRLGAKLVVLHLGAVDMKDYTDRLAEMAGNGQRESPKYEQLCAELLEKREERKGPHMKALFDLLRRILAEAEKLGVRLGVENREALEEIPFETDYPALFRDWPQPALAYWHDTGHAQIKENLGFIHHQLHLESFADRLAGFHIHDVQFPDRDHCAPGTGRVDFAALRPMVKPEHIKVFELSPRLAVEQVKEGVAHIQRLWGAE